MDQAHGSGVVLAQQRLPANEEEYDRARSLLVGRDLQGTVTTFAAAYTHRELAQQIPDQGGDHVLRVKANQPTLLADIDTLFAEPADPTWDTVRQTHKGHGRLETRTLTCSAALRDYLLAWPGGQRVFQRTGLRVRLRDGRTSQVVSYGLTSLSRERAGAEPVEQFCRGHWTIENQSYDVRDET